MGKTSQAEETGASYVNWYAKKSKGEGMVTNIYVFRNYEVLSPITHCTRNLECSCQSFL
ncbi:hypothetical protein Patl1_05457 [Pistacia atlantica]|uniref:Uncharacterized protein n=1 Tax=Pistacia atlantica TaxID=434234 RepID=A0ACC1BRJ5_9ROSI|nr:hypothetical protein Patl1_05457 [Pistacia atlantica]